VVSAGKPVVGARVVFSAYNPRSVLECATGSAMTCGPNEPTTWIIDSAEATTNPWGSATGVITAPSAFATIFAHGFAFEEGIAVLPEVETVVELARETAIEGVLRDDLGRPIECALVYIADNILGPWKTDALGRFRIERRGLGKPYNVTFHAGSFFEEPTLHVVADGSPLDVIARCVSVVRIGVDWSKGRVKTRPTDWSSRVQCDGHVASSRIREADTARDQVVYRGLLRGHYRAVLRVPGLGVGSESFDLDSGERTLTVIPSLSAGRIVSGTVKTLRGEAVAGARVRFALDDPGGASARTDSEGHFELADMPLDDTSFFVSAPGFETVEVPLMHGETNVGPIVLVRGGRE
jgi:hypothetical protein